MGDEVTGKNMEGVDCEKGIAGNGLGESARDGMVGALCEPLVNIDAVKGLDTDTVVVED